MNKKFIVIGIAILLIIVGLSGCFEVDTDGDGYNDDIDAFPNDSTDWFDSDNDGVGDNTDDFPNDANRYFLYEIAESSCYLYGVEHCQLGSLADYQSGVSDRSKWNISVVEKYNTTVYSGFPCEGFEGEEFSIDSNYKYVVCEWDVYNAYNGEKQSILTSLEKSLPPEFENSPSSKLDNERIFFYVRNKEGEFFYNWSNLTSERYLNITVTFDNSGDWEFSIFYGNICYDAIAEYRIYAVK